MGICYVPQERKQTFPCVREPEDFRPIDQVDIWALISLQSLK